MKKKKKKKKKEEEEEKRRIFLLTKLINKNTFIGRCFNKWRKIKQLKEEEQRKIFLLTKLTNKITFRQKFFKWRKITKLSIIDRNEKEKKIKSIEQLNKNEEKIIPLVNPNFQLLPTIILTFDYDCKIDINLYDKLKEEISEIIDQKNFSIIEIQKGSSIAKIILINELAKIGIKASKNQKTSDEINSVIQKIENKKFVCLGNNYPSDSKYNIPDYSKEENRKELVKFLKQSIGNEDILLATSTIKDDDFDKILDSSISNISNQVKMQEINQKKFVLNNLENFNNQIESILEEKKKESVFEFTVTGISLIDRNKNDYENNKKIVIM